MTNRIASQVHSHGLLRRIGRGKVIAFYLASFSLPVAAPAAVSDYSEAVLADRPAAYWRFEEVEGTAAHDSAHRNGDRVAQAGTYHNAQLGIASASPALGRAVRLGSSGSHASHVVLRPPEVLWTRGNLTIEWWQLVEQIRGGKPSSEGPDQTVFSWLASGERGRPGGVTALGIRQSLVDAKRLRYRTLFRAQRLGTRGNDAQVDSHTPVFAGQWYHVAIVFDESDQSVQLLINGQPDGPPVRAGKVRGALTAPVRRRAELGRLVGLGGPRYEGLVDEVAIYDRALSAQRIFAHFRAAVAPLEHVDRVQTIAHRGSSRQAPENTLLAFRKAVEAGSEIVELDVAASSDGVPVVIHDKTVDRTTNGRGEVKGMTAEELTRLDAGSWMSPRFADERVPSLSQAVELLDGQALIALDLKADGLGRGIARVLHHRGLPSDRVILGPWSDEQAADIRAFLPDVPMVLIGEQPGPVNAAMFDAMKRKGYTGFWLKWSTVTRSFIDQAHRRGMPVYVWTINDPPTLAAAILAGVDGIITDEPLRLKRLLSDLRGRP